MSLSIKIIGDTWQYENGIKKNAGGYRDYKWTEAYRLWISKTEYFIFLEFLITSTAKNFQKCGMETILSTIS